MHLSAVKSSKTKPESEIEQVIVLGAGASASEKAPVQNMLFNEFTKVLRKKDIKNSKDHKKIIADYFTNFWGINIHDNVQHNYPTFEECLGMLDLAYSRAEGFRYGYTRENITKSRNSLIYLIAEILRHKLQNQSVSHPILIQRLIDENILSKTVFVSLNYDIIIDNVLLNMEKSIAPDYGIKFTNYSIENPKSYDGFNLEGIHLLKLHGSLNWLYCPTCNEMEITLNEKGAIRAITGDKTCEKCQSIMDPIIIPPTFYKDLRNPFVQQVINQVFQKFCLSKRIIFCGYSFADADIHFKYLLKKAETYRNNTPEIYVINNHATKTPFEKEEERNRYRRFFKNKDSIHYTDLSFEQFCSDGIKNA